MTLSAADLCHIACFLASSTPHACVHEYLRCVFLMMQAGASLHGRAAQCAQNEFTYVSFAVAGILYCQASHTHLSLCQLSSATVSLHGKAGS